MAPFGFVGPSYLSSAFTADAQVCRNWYVEHNESGSGKSEFQMLPCPGLEKFTMLSGSSVRALESINGRAFAVCGTKFYEIFANGTATARGDVLDDRLKAYIAASELQLLIVSGGAAYSFDLASGAFNKITIDASQSPAIQGAVSMGFWSDGYFLVLLAGSKKFQITNLPNSLCTTDQWVASEIGNVSEFPDNIVSVTVDHREVAIIGQKKSVVYYNSGNALFPYQVIPGSFSEMGSEARDGIAKLDNSFFWLGRSEQGAGMAWRAQGYQPVRISNHAIEALWQKYPRRDDAFSYAYQQDGETFWNITFPTANKTWSFGTSTGMWHERSFHDGSPQEAAHRARCYLYEFGKHLVGDRDSGWIYEMNTPQVNDQRGVVSWRFADDFGTPIRRVRRSPYISTAEVYAYFHTLEIEADCGQGPYPPLLDGFGKPRDPQLMLRWSDDGGRSFSNERNLAAGMGGDYSTRMRTHRMGRCWGTRGRIYELSTSDIVSWRIVDAYLDADPSYKPSERLKAQYAKQA